MKKPKKPKSPRQKAREYSVQALYQWQLSHASKDTVLAEFIANHEFKSVDKAYWRELVGQGIDKSADLRASMAPFLSRKVSDITPVELAILTVAFYEFLYRPDVPYRVVINEAIDLAKYFGAADSHRFVNGVLDTAAKKLRSIEVDPKRC